MSNNSGPAPAPNPSEAVVRLANRTAVLSLLSVLMFLVAVLTTPAAFRHSVSKTTRVAAAVPLVVALGTAGWAYRVNGQLRIVREQEELAAIDEQSRRNGA